MDRFRRLTRQCGRVAAANLLLVAALLVASSGIAVAVTGQLGDYTADAVNIRTDPYLTATVVGLGYIGHGLCNDYTAAGDTVGTNPYWAHHHNQTTGKVGFSSWEYAMIYGPPPTGCSW